MTLQTLFVTVLFALTAVAFIGLVNARGVWRTSVVAVLTLFCLGAALWQFNVARAAKKAGVEGVGLPGLYGGLGGVAGHAETAPPAAEPDEPGTLERDSRGEEAPGEAAALVGLVAATRALHDSLAGEDPARARALNDSDYQAFERRAEGYVSRARQLRERAARVSSAPPSADWEETDEALNLSLQGLITAARDLRSFFRATGRDEEQRLIGAFRKGLETAGGSLRRAETGASALTPDPGASGF